MSNLARTRKTNYGIYMENILTRKVVIPFHNIGKNIEDILNKVIARNLEGRCASEGYVKKGSVNIISYSAGVASSENISFDLDQQLSKEGYNIKRIINYRTIHNENFSENFINELKLNMPDIVYIYSQNSALNFLKFIKNNQTENLWLDTNLMCIGEKTSSILNEIKWKKIFLFNPGEEEFLLYKI